MPIYNENPISLYDAIKSIKNLDYKLNNIHVFLAFDDDKTPDAYVYLEKIYNLNRNKQIETINDNGLIISFCRFPHGGKKAAQKNAFQLMEKIYSPQLLEGSYLFYIDSDIQLKSDCVTQFMYYMRTYRKKCLTGMITCVNSKNPNFWTYYQDIEYISGQIFWRNMENFFGASTCLPGAFTILKYSSFKNVSSKYFVSHEYKDCFDYHRFYLGEDRYLTHLLMEDTPYSIGFCEKARCKTDAPDNIMALLKQRKRWYLGHISNDSWMMSSFNFWKKYPFLSVFNFFNNARNASLFIYLIYFSILLNKNINPITWFFFVAFPILLNWMYIGFYAFKTKRKMIFPFYIMIILVQPVLSMLYMYYTIYTFNVNSWGGARVDKEKEKQDDIIVVVEK